MKALAVLAGKVVSEHFANVPRNNSWGRGRCYSILGAGEMSLKAATQLEDLSTLPL